MSMAALLVMKTTWNGRIGINMCTLSGDIGTPGDSLDNNFHVIRAIGTDRNTSIDGACISRTGRQMDQLSTAAMEAGCFVQCQRPGRSLPQYSQLYLYA